MFSTQGEFLKQWTDFKCPMGFDIDGEDAVYVTDQVPGISMLSLDGDLLAQGRTFGYADQVSTDPQGDIYGVDTSNQKPTGTKVRTASASRWACRWTTRR